MARIQYQPTARSRGFRPQQLSTAGIDRMREESNRLIEGMERRRRAEKEQRDTNLQAMRENADYTEQITRENNAIELQNLRNESNQKIANIEGKAKQSQIDYEANISILNSLTGLSLTAVKAIGEKQKNKLEEEQERINSIPIKVRPPEEVEARIRGEQALATGGIQLATENSVEAVLSNEDPLETKKTQLSNPALNGMRDNTTRNRRFGIEGGMVAAARYRDNETFYTAADGRQFTGTQASHNEYFSRELQRITVNDLLKEAGVTDPLQVKEGLKQVNDTFEAYHSQARGAESDLNDAAREQRAKDIEAAGTVEAITVAFADRKLAFGAKAAHDAFQKLIADPNIPLEELAKADFNGNGKSYKDEWPNRWNPAIQDRNKAIVQRSEFEERQKKAEEREWVNANIDSIQEAYNQNPQQAALLVKQRYHGKAMTVPPAITAIEREAFKRNKDLMETTILQRSKFGILDLSFVNSIQDPELQKSTRAAFEAQEEQKYGPESLGIKKGFKATARSLTKINPNEEQGSAQTFLVQARLESEYLKQVKLTNDPLKALENVNKMVDLGRNGDKSSPFYQDTGFLNNRLVFPNIESSDVERQEKNNYVDKQILKYGRGAVDKPFVLADSNEMDAAYASSTTGSMKYPPGIIRYAESTDTKPSEAFNAHRMANNTATGDNKPLIAPTPSSIMVDAASPEMRKLFLSDVPEQIKRGSAMVTGQLPMRSSMSGGDFSSQRNALETAAAELGVDPIDLATIIGFETGGTYDPGVVGGEGDNYQGLIQFGGPERQAYGVVPGMTFEEQLLGPVVRYFKDRFAGAGMSTQGATLEDLYTTVLAGNPRANRDAADSFGTTARSGAKRMFEEHRPAAIKRFGF